MFGLSLTPADLISRLLAIMLAVGVHEFGHAWVAYLMGDDTAKNAGRMTLNPLPNIYWPGVLIAILGGPAILGSAPVNKWRMRNPRVGNFLAVLAGPVFSLLLAALAGLPFQLGLVSLEEAPADQIIPSISGLLLTIIGLNVGAAIISLVPLFPLDGWHIMGELLPQDSLAIWWERNQRNSMYVLGALILLSFASAPLAAISPVFRYLNVLGLIIGPPINSIMRLFIGL